MILVASGEAATVTDVHAFAYRAPRFPLVVPVEFCISGSPVTGHTRDVSERGTLVHLSELVLPGTVGRLRIKIDTCLIELAAEVAFAELFEVGLRFQYASQAEQSFVETLVRVIARRKSFLF